MWLNNIKAMLKKVKSVKGAQGYTTEFWGRCYFMRIILEGRESAQSGHFSPPTHSIIQKDFSIFTKDFSIIHPFVSPFSSNFQTFTRLDQRDHYRQSLGL